MRGFYLPTSDILTWPVRNNFFVIFLILVRVSIRFGIGEETHFKRLAHAALRQSPKQCFWLARGQAGIVHQNIFEEQCVLLEQSAACISRIIG